MLPAFVLLAAALAQAQTAIELRTSASVKAGASVTLADIADVRGDDAESLLATVIVAAPDQRFVEIPVADVRAALEKAGVKWGRTVLRGSVCTLGVKGLEARAGAVRDQSTGRPAPTTVKLGGPETIRTQVARALARMYSVEAGDVRILFEERDEELLRTPTAGKRVDIQPTSSPATAQVGLRIYVFNADRLVTQRTISADVLVRRTVVTASASIARQQAIGPDDYSVGEQWLSPSATVPCTPDEVDGRVARARINPGQVITRSSVEAPVVVNKGDIVEVHCLAGGVHIKATRARALEQGRDGEIVPFRLEGSKKTFSARMSGRGNAVLVVEPSVPAGDGAATPPEDHR
jgi:flagella basal body P-ring formation protein FlgA